MLGHLVVVDYCSDGERNLDLAAQWSLLSPRTGLSDHAAIADQHYPLELEALLELADLACQCHGIGDIAFEHLNRHRTSLSRAQKPKHDLQLSPLAVAVEPQSGKRAGAAFEIGRGDVVENQRPLPQMPPGQRLLDALLLFHQPVERRIKLLLVNPPEFEHLAQRASRRLAIKTARRRQLGRRIDKPCHDHGDRQRHLACRLPATLGEDTIEPELTQKTQRRRDMAMRKTPHHPQSLRIHRRCYRVIAQDPPQRLDLRCRPTRQVGKRALPDLVAIAIALAKQNRWRRTAIGDDLDVHGELESQPTPTVKPNQPRYMGTEIPACHDIMIPLQSLSRKTDGNFRLWDLGHPGRLARRLHLADLAFPVHRSRP